MNVKTRVRQITLALLLLLLVSQPASGIVDSTPPDIVSFDIEPRSVNTALSWHYVTATARLTDDYSGYSGGTCVLRSPSGDRSIFIDIFEGYRISGNELDGIYKAQGFISRGQEAGTWYLWSCSLSDRVSNTQRLSREQLLSRGITATLEVIDEVSQSYIPMVATQ